MVISRSVPQQTAQIFSALAGQKRPGLRFWQIGQVTISSPGSAKLAWSRIGESKWLLQTTQQQAEGCAMSGRYKVVDRSITK